MIKNGHPTFFCAIHDKKVNCIDCFLIEANDHADDIAFYAHKLSLANETIKEQEKEIKQLRHAMNDYQDKLYTMIDEFKYNYRIVGKSYPMWLKRHFVMEELIEKIKVL